MEILLNYQKNFRAQSVQFLITIIIFIIEKMNNFGIYYAKLKIILKVLIRKNLGLQLIYKTIFKYNLINNHHKLIKLTKTLKIKMISNVHFKVS